MTSRFTCLWAALALFAMAAGVPAAEPLPVAELKRETPVDFTKEVLPILTQSCTACHNEFVDEGGLILETPEAILKGGRRGPAVVAGKPEDSWLWKFSSHTAEPIMPPKKNSVEAPNLNAQQLAVLKLWIEQGASGEVRQGLQSVQWQALPPGINPIYAVALSPDGQYVACGRANQVFIYHLPTGYLITRLTDPELLGGEVYSKRGVAHLDLVQAMTFSPDGNLLATGGFRTVKLWQRPQHVRSLEVAAGKPARSVAASPDGKLLATGTEDGRVKVVALDGGKQVADLEAHTGPVTDLEFLADGRLVSASIDGSARLWAMPQGEPLAQVFAPAAVNAVTVAGKDSPVLALGSEDNTIRLFDLGAVTATTELPTVEGKPTLLASSPDRKRLAVAAADGQVRLIDVAENKVAHTINPGQGELAALDFNRDGSRLLTLSKAGQITVWNTGDAAQVVAIAPGDAGPFTAATLHPNGDHVAAARQDGSPALFKLEGAEAQPQEREFEKLPQPAATALFHPDGNTIYFACADGTLRAVNTGDGKTKFNAGHGAKILSAALSPDGQWLATGGENNEVRVWNAGNGQNGPKPQLGGFEQAVAAVAFSADGQQIIAGSAAGQVMVFRRDEGDAVQKFQGTGAITGLALIGEEKPSIAMASAEAGLTTKQVAFVRSLTDHSQPVRALATFPNNPDQIVSGGADGTVRLWNVTNGQQVRSINHGGEVTGVAVRPDGQRIASSSTDKTARIWDAGNGQQKAELKGDIRAVRALAATEKALAKAKRDLDAAKKQLADAEKDLPTKNEALTKATAEKDKQTKAFDEKKAAYDKLAAEKQQADNKVAETSSALTKAKEAQEAAAEALKKAEGDDQKKAAEEAKKQADQAVADADKAAKEAADAAKKLEKPVQDAEKELKAAEIEMQKAVRAFDDAVKQQKAAEEAVPAAKQAVASGEELHKQLEAEKEQRTAARTEAEKPLLGVAYSADGLQIATAGEDGLVHLWDGESGAAQEVQQGHGGPVRDVTFLPGETLIASAADDAQMYVWDQNADWQLVRTIGNVNDASLLVHRVLSLDFSPDGSLLATGGGEPSRSGELKLWKVADGSLVREIPEAHSDTIFTLEFSPDGAYVASGAADKFMKVFNVGTGELVRSFEGHTHHVQGVSWQDDMELLASAGADNVVKVWKFATGEQHRTIQGFGKQVTALEFIGETDQFVTACGDNTVRIHRASNGGKVRDFGGASDFVNAVAVSEDGKLVVGGGADSVLRIWQGDNGQTIRNFEAPQPAGDKVAASE